MKDLNHHHQLNAPTAGARAFLIDLPTRRTGHNPLRGISVDWWVLTTANTAGTNGLTCLPKHFGHPFDNRPVLLSFRGPTPSALTAGPSSSSGWMDEDLYNYIILRNYNYRKRRLKDKEHSHLRQTAIR
jgi:hypothetical protein